MSIGLNNQTTNINNIQPKVQVAFKAQTTPVKNYPSDTVEIQRKKKGLSTGAKWGIGLGLTTLIGLVAYLISRGRAGAKSVKQIAEHIDFKEAKNMDEAIKFAQENFGIKLDLGDNLFAANFINESCVNVSNKMKGKAYFPKKIKFGSVDGNGRAPGGFCKSENIIIIDCKNSFINTSGTDFYSIFNRNLKEKYHDNYSKFIKEKEDLSIISIMRKLIYHELGHCNHAAICKDYHKMGKLKELGFVVDKSITKEFLNTKSIQETASKVSDYAKESPAEFIAETFAGLIEGKTYSNDVMALYKKYGGPII